jgi:hypothetical protein
MVPKVGCTDPWGAVVLPMGMLSGKGAAGGAEDGSLRERHSFVYD